MAVAGLEWQRRQELHLNGSKLPLLLCAAMLRCLRDTFEGEPRKDQDEGIQKDVILKKNNSYLLGDKKLITEYAINIFLLCPTLTSALIQSMPSMRTHWK